MTDSLEKIQAVAKLPKVKAKLTIPLMASYLSCGYRVTDISRATGHVHQWVSFFIKKNYDALMPLIDDRDVYSAMQAKHVALMAKEKLTDVMSTCKTFDKRDLIPLTAVSDRHMQQYRLLSDKPTANISIDQIRASREENEVKIKELRAELKKVKEGGLSR